MQSSPDDETGEEAGRTRARFLVFNCLLPAFWGALVPYTLEHFADELEFVGDTPQLAAHLPAPIHARNRAAHGDRRCFCDQVSLL